MSKRLIMLAAVAVLILATACDAADPASTATPFSNVPQGGDATSSPDDDDTPATEDAPAPGQAICSINPPVGPQIENLPPVTGDDWIRGAPDAPVTLINYSSYQ